MFVLSSVSTNAAERQLSGLEIGKLLPAIIVLGGQTKQTFTDTGATTYSKSEVFSHGRWRVQGKRYCSQWPPAKMWVCYDVLVDGKVKKKPDTIIWVGDSKGRTVNHIEYRKR
jgi:hypothetical protein